MKPQISNRFRIFALVATLGFVVFYIDQSLSPEESLNLARNIDVNPPQTRLEETSSNEADDETVFLDSTVASLSWGSGMLLDPLAEQVLLVNSILKLNNINVSEEKIYAVAQLTSTGKNILNALDARLSNVDFKNDTVVFKVEDYPEAIRNNFRSKFLKELEGILGNSEYSGKVLDSLSLYLRGFGEGTREVTIKSRDYWYHISDLTYPMTENSRKEYLESGGVVHSDLQDIDLPESNYLYFVDRAKKIRSSTDNGTR